MSKLIAIALIIQIVVVCPHWALTTFGKSSRENCASETFSSVYAIKLPEFNATFLAYCDDETSEGGWTLVLNRFKGKLDFHDREWDEYRNGFGGFFREYFIGLEKLHMLTKSRSHSLLILMEDFDDVEYSTSILEFEVEDERFTYQFKSVRKFSGTEIGLPAYDVKFCAPNVLLCDGVGWVWNGNYSKVTKNRLNVFGPYLKVGANSDENTMGFYNEDTKTVHPLRSIKMLMRPVNIFRKSYGDTFSKYY